MANLDSTIRFIIKAEGEQAAVAALAKIEAAAEKAGTSVSKFMKTQAGESLSNRLKLAAASAGELAKETDKAANSAGRAAKAHDALTTSTRRSYFAQTALTTVLSAGINQAFLQFIDITGQAIQRVDLMGNFPATMTSMGESADDATESMKTLSRYIGEIGGNLGTATSLVTRFTGVTQNVKAATAVFTGLNNALIAGDSSLEEQRLAVIQFAQALERGKPDMREWNSLTQNMSFQLKLVADAMGIASPLELGEQLRDGTVSMAAFVTKLTELSTGEGAIAKQAEARMNGIQFTWNKFKNTMVEGMTAIIQTIGRQNIVDFFNLLSGVMRTLATYAVQLLSILFSLFNMISRVFGGPQLKLAKDNTEAIASNLGAGAGGASDLADGLDDASKAAKKTANQLASFDKMNVLTEPTDSGKDKEDDKGGGTNFDPSQLAKLEDIFKGIGGELPEITNGAKILAGILASLIGLKFAQGLANQFNGLVKTIDDTTKNLKRMTDALTGAEDQDKKNKKGLFKNTLESFKEFGGAVGGLVLGFAALFKDNKVVQAAARFGKLLIAPILGAVGIITGLLQTLVIFVAGFVGGSIALAIGVIIAIVAAIAVAIFFIVKYWDEISAAVIAGATAFKDFMVMLWQGLVEVIRSIWNQLYDIFAAPIKWFLDLFQGIFIAIVAIVAIAVQLIVGLIVLLVKGIFTVLSAIAGWVFDNVIQPVTDFFVGLWNGIVKAAQVAWNFIFVNVLAPVANWIFGNVITPVLNFFKSLWDTVSGFVSAFYRSVVNFLSPVVSWIYNNVIAPVAGFFAGLWNGISAGLSGMINGFSGLLGGIVNIFKTILNGIVDLLNIAIRGVNKLKVPDWVPGLGGKSPGIREIPRLAQGGIVTQPTFAEIGENGKEAIVPLENNLEWLDKLADKINSTSGGANGQPIYLTVQIGEDKVATKIIDLINEKTQMSGRNAIFV